MQIDILNSPQGEAFPIIDFKFVNTGAVAAMMHRFHVIVASAEIDVTPELAFSYQILPTSTDGSRSVVSLERHTERPQVGSLDISIRNNGWGPAHNVTVELDFGAANDLFKKRTFEIASSTVDDSVTHLYLGPEYLHSTEIPNLAAKLKREASDRSDWCGGRVMGVPVSDVLASWRAVDANGDVASGVERISQPDCGSLYVTERGFLFESHLVMACMGFPDARYCSILDPEEGAHRRSYEISRVIAPGEGDQFQIIIGSTKSARYQLSIGFSVNNTPDIESELFDISIWKPKRCRWDSNYIDGDVARLRESDQAVRRSGALGQFPFFVPDKRERWLSDYL